MILAWPRASVAQAQSNSAPGPAPAAPNFRELSKDDLETLLKSSTDVRVLPIIKDSRLGNDDKLSALLKQMRASAKGLEMGRAASTDLTNKTMAAVKGTSEVPDLGVFSYDSAIKFSGNNQSTLMIVCKFCGTAIFARQKDSTVEVSDQIKIDSLDELLSTYSVQYRRAPSMVKVLEIPKSSEPQG